MFTSINKYVVLHSSTILTIIRRVLGWLALTLVSFGSVGLCHAAIYYVDGTNGADSNVGSLDRPFQTIKKATDVVAPGDTVYIRQGTYRETIEMTKSGTEEAPIVFRAHQGEQVTISGADVVQGGWTSYKDGIYQTSAQFSLRSPVNYQVFANEKMVPQAREPNLQDPYDPFSQNWLPMAQVG